MKVLVLAPANVIHTQRWVEGLNARGVEVVLATQHVGAPWQAPGGVRVVRLPVSGPLGYFANAFALRRLLRSFKPDLLNAHYASGYGTTAALARFRPWLLSVWGSDVYDFPYEGRLKGAWLRHNLRRADRIASTSEAMAAQVRELIAPRDAIAITPFGIDTARFAPVTSAHLREGGFVIGTVKTLAPKYGIDVLIRAHAAFAATLPEHARRGAMLVIVGDGPQRAELEELAAALGTAAQVRFVGAVAHAEVPAWLNRFDVYVAASRLDSESFGVAVLEASACAVPVVVSDAGGLPEVVVHGVTGLIVPRDDVTALAAALGQLAASASLRERLGLAGRQRVLQHYEWSRCVDRMLACYRDVIDAPASAAAPRVVQGPGIAQRVSVIVPCRNERGHIDAFCVGVWRQKLPPGWSLDVLISDGQSDDGTAERLRVLCAAEPRLTVIANPRGIVSTGLNLALHQAQGEVIVRMDVHTSYADDYIAQCLAALRETGADNVGGPWHALPSGDADAEPMQHAVAAAFQSRWVTGGAASRRLGHDGWVDTVYLGCWPRASLVRFGGFDEHLVRNQDDEHNLRIVRGGGRVWQSSRVRSHYQPRARLAQVARQQLQYGYWKPFVMKKHGQAASFRQLVPGLFVATLSVLASVALVSGLNWPLLALVAAYGAVLLLMTSAVASSAALGMAAAVRVPLVIAVYHLGYGAGSLWGAWDALWHRRGRDRFATLSR